MNKLKEILWLLVIAVALCSCSDSKFDKAVTTLGTVPVFLGGEDRINQSVNYEDGKLIIEVPYDFEKQEPEWAVKLIGHDWLPPMLIWDLLGRNLTAFGLGVDLDTKEGESPIEDFLSRMDEKNATFFIKYGNHSASLSTDDVRRILKEKVPKDFIAYSCAKGLVKYAEIFNGSGISTLGGISMVDATVSNGTLYVNYICQRKGVTPDIKTIGERLLQNSRAISAYCHLNNLGLAFRYRRADSQNYSLDQEYQISRERLADLWKKLEKDVEKQQ